MKNINWTPDIGKMSENELLPIIGALRERGLIKSELMDFATHEIIKHLEDCGEWPTIKKFTDEEILEAFTERDLKIRPDDDDPIKDGGALNEAIDRARDGDIGLCGHFLIRAIPGLWPLRKILRV